MPLFIYTARTKDGRVETGSLEAPDQDRLLLQLQERGLLVTSIVLGAKEEVEVKHFRKKKRLHFGVRLDDLILLSRQLATLLDAGVPLLRSLSVVSDQVESRSLNVALETIHKEVEEGKALSEALKRHPKIFSRFWINLVETGEASGQLPFVFDQIARYLEEAGVLHRKIISALIYPTILTVTAVGAITLFMVRIIPIFERVFQDFQLELPLLTRMIIRVSSFIRHYFAVEILLILGFIIIFQMMRKSERSRLLLDRWKLKLPIFGHLFEMVAMERFASALSVLIKSGVPILYALEIVEKSANNKIIERALEKIKSSVRSGRTISRPMMESDIFPPLVVEMVEVGEEAGELANMLSKLGTFYKERIDTFVTRLTAIFEPLVLVVMGFVVGVIVISMFLPVFGLSGAIRGM